MRDATIAIDTLFTQPADQSLRPVWPRFMDMAGMLRGMGKTVATFAGQLDTAGLESVNLENANLVGFDRLGLRSRTATLRTLSIEKVSRGAGPAMLDIKARLTTETGDWLLSGSWTAIENNQHRLALQASGIKLQDLLEVPPASVPEADMAIDLAVKFEATYDAKGNPLPASVALTTGSGVIPIGDKGVTARLQKAFVAVKVDPSSNQLNIVDSQAVFDGSTVLFTGAIRYPSSAQDSISLQPAFRLDISQFQAFGLVGAAEAPNGALLVEGFIDPIRQTVVADQIKLVSPNGTMLGDASVRMDGPKPHIKAMLSIASMPVDEFKQFWPPIMAPKTRDWIDKNISGGELKDAWVKLNFPPGMFGRDELYTKDNLSAQISLQSTRLQNADELPAIENASGVVEVLGNHTNITLTGGQANIEGVGRLKVGKSTMKMGSYAVPLTPARLDLNLTGPAAAMIKLASLEPLGFENRLNIGPKEVGGTATANVEAHFLIGKRLQMDKQPWNVRLKGRNISSKKRINGRKLTKGNLSIVASPKQAKITGTARLNDVPVKLALTESLDGSGASSAKIVMTLSDRDRARIGLDTGNVMKGPVEASLTDLPDGTRRVEANLKNAKLNFPWIGWTKGKGIPAKASFSMRENKGTTRFEEFKLNGPGFSAQGAFVVDKTGLLQADMKNVKLNQIDDFDLTVNRSGGGYDIGLDARTYDGRALIRSLLGAEIKPSQSEAASISVQGKIGRLIGFGSQSLTDVVIDFQQKGKKVSRVVVEALAPANSPTRFAMGPAPGGTQLEIATKNAGSVLRFLDLYSKIRGGTIDTTLSRDASQTFRGRVIARDFELLNEPRLAELLKKPQPAPDLQNEGEITRNLPQFNTDRARVDELQATIEKGTGFLRISRGRLWGGDAGAAFDGTVYDQSNRMNVKGTFLPGRGLNRLASKIPLLGLAFGRGKVYGLVGITFQLVGRFDNPNLRVNPLSVIAPGVFREIFKF